MTHTLPAQIQALAERLRQPRLPRAELQRCAGQLDALALELTGALELCTLQRDVSLKLSLALQDAGTMALQAHTLTHHQVELLQGGRSLGDLLAAVPDSGPVPADELARLRPDAAGRYAWDRWQAEALEAGLSQDLAQLGRAVMREAVQHAWSEEHQRECGWRDQGQVMLVQALQHGETTAQRWRHLLETDGERGYWDEATGEWRACGGDQ